MNYNTFLLRFGFNPVDFKNKEATIVEGDDDSIIYELEQEIHDRTCPNCFNPETQVKDHDWVEITLNTTIGKREYLRIRKTRFKCPKCKTTFTPSIQGIERYEKISDITKQSIIQEFYKIQSFKDTADRYGVSVQTVIDLFDEYTKIMPRRPLPEYLCIDEKHFEGDTSGKYVVVLSDFFTGEVIDVLENRQMPYLERYFDSISFYERRNVKVFISDMYDGYSSIKDRYFSNALFVVDLFHVIKQLTEIVKKIRVITYKQFLDADSLEYHFLKTNWKIFLCDQCKIRKNLYHSSKFDITIPYGEIILRCLRKNQVFWDAYDILQELLHYDKYEFWNDANKLMERIINKLVLSCDDMLIGVAMTYKKWKVGILNGLARNQTGRRYSNSVAEGNNSMIDKIIDVSNGYKKFKRFRARIMLIMTYNNQNRESK